MHSVFAAIDREPLAAASIGQAHAATVHDGTEVVVKIRRPGAVEEVREELVILLNLAARASRHWPVIGSLRANRSSSAGPYGAWAFGYSPAIGVLEVGELVRLRRSLRREAEPAVICMPLIEPLQTARPPTLAGRSS